MAFRWATALLLSLVGLSHAATTERVMKSLNEYVQELNLKTEQNMTLKEAVQAVRSIHLPPAVAHFVANHMHQNRKHSQAQSFLEVSSKSSPYGDISSTQTQINGLILETINKLGNENLRCLGEYLRLYGLISQSTASIAAFNSLATGARGEILTAQSKISFLSTKIPQLGNQLWAHNHNCALTDANYALQIAVLNHDIGVMVEVVKFAECGASGPGAAATALVQCRSQHNRTSIVVRHDKVRDTAGKLKSPAAKNLLYKLMQETADASAEGVSFIQEAQVPTKSCSIATSPDCDIIFDKILGIQAGLMDKRDGLVSQRSHFSGQCSQFKSDMEQTINNHNLRLSDAQADLAKGTKDLWDAEEQARVEEQNRKDLVDEFFDEQKECNKNKAQFESEECGLKKIRTEMKKIAGGSLVFFQDCEVTDWREGTCSVPCGGGTQTLYRDIKTPSNGGAGCPDLTTTQPCNEHECPIDCQLDEWSGWSACSALCGGGVEERARNILQMALHQGQPCGDLTDTEECNVQDCSKPCVLSAWSPWSTCSKECEGGTQTRMRSVVEPAVGDGQCWKDTDPERLQFQSGCNPDACKIPANNVLECKAKIDVILLIDGSSSLGADGWAASVDFSAKFLRALGGTDSRAKAAVLQFTGPRTWDEFDMCHNGTATDIESMCGITEVSGFTNQLTSLADTVAGLSFPGGSTFTSFAVRQADALLSYGRGNAAKIVVVLTDGMPISLHQMDLAVFDIRTKTRLMFVPVGSSISEWDIEYWASKPTKDNIVWVRDMEDLAAQDTVNALIEDLCPAEK